MMDECELAKLLNRRDPQENLPVFVLTADGSVRTRAGELGGGGFLSKPFDIDIDDLPRHMASLTHA